MNFASAIGNKKKEEVNIQSIQVSLSTWCACGCVRCRKMSEKRRKSQKKALHPNDVHAEEQTNLFLERDTREGGEIRRGRDGGCRLCDNA